MNKYYKVSASYDYVAVRQNGEHYAAPGAPIKASRELLNKAKICLIPTLYPSKTGLKHI